MHVALILLTAVSAHAFSTEAPHPLPWSPAGPGDVRSPCPGLNSLANHGFLPHDGKFVTEQQTVSGLGDALNIDAALAKLLFQGALATNPSPNATNFSLDDLSRHNIIEHDGSLSRQDYYFGDNHDFNQTIFDQTRGYWTHALIDLKDVATARAARMNTSMATNPEFGLSNATLTDSFAESATYLLAFGNKTAGTVNRTWVEYFFENERLPDELGWVRQSVAISQVDLDSMTQRVVNATGTAETRAEVIRRGGIHGPLLTVPQDVSKRCRWE
ncbi:Cloroperoxidase [Aspergillus heteromorphus CBS 117.55]|uniref:Cloroperoxidase n=1 Tax=Aspergillus heteromorphus CBS 117.55 TaxID=1448321 RepID=A0A317VD19_9EURO|nr:Cloroperoxidase [Aspergillus heteromorphus CBS 117.55]PWY72263.1 Cloroperoxidase [Aspergillus heteromorphus CBS 117.55]